MTNILLYSGQQQTVLTDILLLTALGIALIAAIALIIWQRRTGRQLTYELEQLAKIKKSNVEYEFVLKTMHLSTWHIDPATHEIVFDSDFRGKGDTYVPSQGGTTADLSANMLEQDRPKVGKMIEDLCAGRTDEAHVEYRMMIPHSHKVYWSESYAIVAERDIDGKPSRIVGTSMRIDERKAMEEALVEARNRAEESDRLKSAFLANMSHEIRTPLNAIVGFTSVLPDVQEPEERKALLDLIHENTQKLLLIIDDVVNISKVEAGKEELVLTAFDLCITLHEMADRLKANVHEGVSVETRFAATTQTITTDRNRLVEVMKHLLSNAAKFTTHGSIVIGFDTPADGRIRIFVQDTGKGIAPEHQERIFERFFKVDEFVPGAGLGLSICRTMAYSLGGTIGVESALGEGSLFWLDIPMQ